ncbi:MAG: hypothetical protein Q4E63_07070 [Prevotellaceae bacterium]|nr:hypothetical protein [Prevotellaceae bacterium]
MKKLHFILYLFYACWLLGCIGCASLYRTQHNKDFHQSEDSVILSKWGETGKVLTEYKNFGRIYKLNPLTNSSKNNSIAGFLVTDTLQSVNSIQSSALLFALQSPFFYAADSTSFKSVFAPFIAIEIQGKNKTKQYLLLSYNNRELALASDSMVIKRRKYDNHKFFLSLGLSLLPNDNYLKTNYELSK